jgi:hypothetical protein
MGSYGGLRRWFGSRISGPVVVATPSELAAGRGGPEHLWDGGFLGRGRLDRDVRAVGPRRSVMLSCRSWSGKVLTKMRFALFAVGIVAVAVVPVSGQVIWDGGMQLAALSEHILVRVSVTARDAQCSVSTQVLEAEAERTLRRDGLVVGRPAQTLVQVSVITMTTSVADVVVGCVSSLRVQLLVVVPETEIVVLAADDSTLFVSGRDGAHVGQIRAPALRSLYR